MQRVVRTLIARLFRDPQARRQLRASIMDDAHSGAIGGTFIAPDTARVTVVCSGDATGREFRIYRLDWADTETTPPFAPPISGGCCGGRNPIGTHGRRSLAAQGRA